MKLEFAFLADAVTGLPNGTFDVIQGGIDEFTGEIFPATEICPRAGCPAFIPTSRSRQDVQIHGGTR